MPANIGIFCIDQYRRVKPVENAIEWAKSRRYEHTKVTLHDLKVTDWDNVSLLYIPLCRDVTFLENVPASVPVVLDYDGAEAGKLDGYEILSRHRHAFRRAFGGKIKYSPQLQVPYLHLPLEAEEKTRDVIVIDTHQWLPSYWHFSLLSVLAFLGHNHEALCTSLDLPLKYYLTSFVPLEPYFESSQVFVEKNGKHPALSQMPVNDLQPLLDNLIHPLEDVYDYYELMARARLFISDHGDLADQDIVHAGSLGVPIYLLPRTPLALSRGISSSLIKSISIIEPRYRKVLKKAEKARMKNSYIFMNRHNLVQYMSKEKFEKWDVGVMRDAYYKSWDMLCVWAVSNKINSRVNRSIIKSSPWGF